MNLNYWRLLSLLVFILLITNVNSQTIDCKTASSTQCGQGYCSNYVFSNNLCQLQSPTCSQTQFFTNATNQCNDCSGLDSSNCASQCSQFNFFTNTPTNYLSAGSLNGCNHCQNAFGLGCTSCDSSTCKSCQTLATLNSSTNKCMGSTCTQIENCIICASSTSCKLCLQGYDLNLNTFLCDASTCKIKYCLKCQTTLCGGCYSGYKLSTGKDLCQPSCKDINCVNCIKPDVCAACAAGYILNSKTSTCVLDCSTNQVSNCYSCSNLNTCTSCIQGYHLEFQGTKCFLDCTVSNCIICSQANICTLCARGYKLSDTNNCISDTCQIDYCNNCATINSCGTCANNFQISNNNSSCVPSCINPIPKCLLCSSATSCSSCAPGYKLANGANSTSICQKICTINNCQVCQSTTTCLQCQTGYALADDRKTCKLQCISNCDICNDATTCGQCLTGFTPVNNNCVQNCLTGQIFISQKCTQCNTSDSNCIACRDNGGVLQCSSCNEGYYLDSAFKCQTCQSRIQNCILCSGSISFTCNQCRSPSKLTQGLCISCSILNCENCQISDNTKCANCTKGFQLQTDGTCTLKAVTCPQTTILINGECKCAIGSYLSNSICTLCQTNCVNCSSSVCSQCISGYFPSGMSCIACQTNCLSCTSQTACTQCSDSTSLNNGDCISLGDQKGIVSGNTVISCSIGCKSCTLGVNNIVICTSPEDGYSLVNGVPVKCDSKCKTCSPGNPSICRSCFSGFALQDGQICVVCGDSNALTCADTNKDFSLSCKFGYSTKAAPGKCNTCPKNCLKCDIADVGKCDASGCDTGYTLDETQQCVNCFNNCPFCDKNDPRICLRCDNNRYLSNSVCLKCSNNCKTCNSATDCIQCNTGFVLITTTANKFCATAPVFPCAGINENLLCNRCFQGFNIVNNICTFDTNCNSTQTCTSCEARFYLSNRQCLPCTLSAGCRRCFGTTANNCQRCENGFYLQNGACIKCSQGCSRCQNSVICKQASSGWYITLDHKRQPSGIVSRCTSPCQLCENFDTYCIRCINGYNINGATCFSARLVVVKVVYKPTASSFYNQGDTAQVKLRKAMNNLYSIKKDICTSLPDQLKVGQDQICSKVLVIVGLKAGSLDVDFKVDSNTKGSAADATSLILDSINTKKIGGAEPTVSSSGTQGYSDSQNSNVNLGLILGVAIPLGLIFILIIIFTVYYRKMDEDQAYDSKDIYYEEVGQENNI